jgi:hypothetical protein
MHSVVRQDVVSLLCIPGSYLLKTISCPALLLFNEDGNSMFFRIAGTYLPIYTVSYPKRKQPSVVKIFVRKS